jgi:PAS domain-containing protein
MHLNDFSLSSTYRRDCKISITQKKVNISMSLDAYTVDFEVDSRSEPTGEVRKASGTYLEALTSIRSLRSLLDLGETQGSVHLQHEIERSQDSALSVKRMGAPLFAAYLRSCPEPKVICSADGLVHYLNPAAQRLLGYHDAEIAAHKFASLLMPVPPDELALSQDYWDAAARRGTLKARKASGEIFPVSL